MKWGLVTESGTIVKKDHFSSVQADSSVILNGIKDIILQYQHDISGVAISAPGFIKPDTGYIEKGGAITGFDETPLKALLEKEFSLPVSIENDVNCVALAEKWQGNAKELTDFVCLTVGTGIGGALFLNNALYRGHAFRGGEFGYMVTQGLHSNNLLQDTLSYQASLQGVRRKYAEHFNVDLPHVTGEKVFHDYDTEDPAAVHIVEHFYQTLALGIFNITSVVNPEKILIGGGITSRASFLTELRRHLSYIDRVFNVEIDICHFKNDAGIIGALAFHLQNTSDSVSRMDKQEI